LLKGEEMKKSFCLLIVLGALLLSACAEPPGPELSSLPEDFFLEKAREEGQVYRVPDEREDFKVEVDPYPSFSKGNFIYLRHINNGLFQVSVIHDYNELCTWSKEISDPRYFEVKEQQLYFTDENCEGIGDKTLIWVVDQNIGYFQGEDTEFAIILLVGSQEFLLPPK
jgi:hypothetical protein